MEVLKWIGCGLAAALFIGAIAGMFFVGYLVGVIIFWAITTGITIYTLTKFFKALTAWPKNKK
jgi:membrane protein implicated in regulation of membrane protease activity